MCKSVFITCLGKTGSGGTSISYQFVRGQFLEGYDNSWDLSNRGKITVDGESFNLEIVDPFEDEEYSAVRDQYMRRSDGFLLVYSITDRSSFEDIERKIAQVCRIRDVDDDEDVPMVLVGNKCDREDDRQVLFEEGHEFAERHGIPFFETSAKTSINVNEAFEALVRRCEEKKEPDSSANNNDKNSKKDKKCIIQ